MQKSRPRSVNLGSLPSIEDNLNARFTVRTGNEMATKAPWLGPLRGLLVYFIQGARRHANHMLRLLAVICIAMSSHLIHSQGDGRTALSILSAVRASEQCRSTRDAIEAIRREYDRYDLAIVWIRWEAPKQRYRARVDSGRRVWEVFVSTDCTVRPT